MRDFVVFIFIIFKGTRPKNFTIFTNIITQLLEINLRSIKNN